MVSGVGVTLLRLADSLAARGHLVRVYTPSYRIPDGAEDRPEVFRVPSVPFFLYPDVRWAFPRMRRNDMAHFGWDTTAFGKGNS